MSTRLCRRAALLALGAGLLAPGPSAAQAPATCGPTETLQGCYSRAALGRVQPAVELGAKERDELKGKTSGPEQVSDAASAIRDFLPRLVTSLITSGPTAGPDALSLRANLPLLLNDGVLSTWGFTAQVGTLIHEAEPFAALVDSLPESSREATRTRLREGMELYDDLSITGALNFESTRMGRSFRSHQRLVQQLAAELATATPADIQNERDAADVARDFFITDQLTTAMIAPDQAKDAACQLTPQSRASLPVRCLSAGARLTYQRLVQRVADVEASWRADAERGLAASGFNRLSELINNQPQLNAAVEYRTRSDVAGPDEWTGRARLEYSRANMNRLRGFCRERALRAGTPRPAGVEPVDLACLQEFTDSEGVRQSLSRGGRFWAEAVVNHRPDYEMSLADEGARLVLASATTMALSGGYGAYFGNPDDGANRDRFDFQGKYDFTRDDALRQDRAVVTAFYTRHLSDQSSAVVGLTWASKPEFVGDADRKLGANLGFTYRLHQPDRPAAAAGGNGGSQ